MAALRRRDLLRVFLRSLALQASWSFEGMQSLGVAYALEPALRRIHGDRAAGALEGHLGFFNTHPFLAAAILGAVVRLEEQGDHGGALRLKAVLMGPYGAVGDGLYWGALKPLLVLAAVAAGFGGAPWAPWGFLGLFGAANLAGRGFLFAEGYRRGFGIVERVNRLDLVRWARRLKGGVSVLLGVAVVAALGGPGWAPSGVLGWLWSAAAAAFVLLAARLLAAGLSPVLAVYVVAALAAVVVVWR